MARRVNLSQSDLESMHANLDSNQRNHFAVVGGNGKVIAQGDDFQALRNQVIVQSEQSGTRIWPVQQAEREKARHTTDLGRELAQALELPLKRVTSRWGGAQAGALAASPYSSTAALVADAHLAAGISLTEEYLEAGKAADDVSQLEQLKEWARDRFEDRIYDILLHTAAALSAGAEVHIEAEKSKSELVASTRQICLKHVESLLYPGFVGQTPFAQLPQLRRYLCADQLRLQKARSNAAGDQRLQLQFDTVKQQYLAARQLVESRPFDAEQDRVMQQARWLLEEYYVSVFAQQLGTSVKVSPQRLAKLLQRIPRD